MADGLLHQIIYLMEPIGLAWLCLLVLTLWLAIRRQWKPAVLAGLGMLLMTVVGSTSLAGRVLGSLERPYAGVNI